MLQIHGNRGDMDCLKLAVLACKALPSRWSSCRCLLPVLLALKIPCHDPPYTDEHWTTFVVVVVGAGVKESPCLVKRAGCL
jgi:hypothetical protein